MFGKNKIKKLEELKEDFPLPKIQGSFQDNDEDNFSLGNQEQTKEVVEEPMREPIVEEPQEVITEPIEEQAIEGPREINFEEQVGRTIGEIINALVDIESRLKDIESWAFRAEK